MVIIMVEMTENKKKCDLRINNHYLKNARVTASLATQSYPVMLYQTEKRVSAERGRVCLEQGSERLWEQGMGSLVESRGGSACSKQGW